MKKTATALLALLLASSFAVSAFAAGPFWVKGDYYAGTAGTWNADAGNAMTESGGVWSATVTCDQAYARHEFKVANADWSESYFPWCNLWVHCGTGDAVHFTLDTNSYADGWLPSTNIVWSDHAFPAGTTFEVIGGAAETGSWSSGVPATLIGGIWTRVATIATPGSYEAKFRATGSWDVCNIGSEGAGAPCGANLQYTTTLANTDVRFEFNPATGRARAEVLGVTATTPTTFGQLKARYR